MKKTIISLTLFFSFVTSFGQSKIPVGYHTFIIKNCRNESRIVNPLTSVNGIYYLVYGSAEFKKMKTLNFSNSYKVDTNYITTNVAKLKGTLPKNYFGMLTGYEYSNQPNDDSIWFIKIFAQINNSGQVKIFSAYKMTFEGTDPSAESFRANPKITNIQFILDKKQLIELEKKLKELSKGTIH
jgi:hypothetical protein